MGTKYNHVLFWELISEGMSVKEVAKKVGMDYYYANSLIQRMRRRMGEQGK